jgi:predicted metal-binding membrane protein
VSLSAGLGALAGDGRERRIVIAALAALTLISWAYLWLAPMPMPASSGGLRTPHYGAFTFAMWFVMMIGMMTPSAAPTLLLFERVQRSSCGQDASIRTALFLVGYLCTWAIFSAVATLVQIELIELGWIDDMAVTTRGSVTALVLLVVGLYQWLPLKRACLDHCRSPAEFIFMHRRPGRSGAWTMGLHHGVHCLGCCWALMLLLFVGGVMNLLWVAAITALVLVEKVFVRGAWMRHAIGVACVLASAVIAAGSF